MHGVIRIHVTSPVSSTKHMLRNKAYIIMHVCKQLLNPSKKKTLCNNIITHKGGREQSYRCKVAGPHWTMSCCMKLEAIRMHIHVHHYSLITIWYSPRRSSTRISINSSDFLISLGRVHPSSTIRRRWTTSRCIGGAVKGESVLSGWVFSDVLLRFLTASAAATAVKATPFCEGI